MSFIFATKKPTRERSFQLVSVSRTPKGRSLIDVESMSAVKKSTTTIGAGKKFMNMVCGKSTFSRILKERSNADKPKSKSSASDCVYYITIKEVDDKTFEPTTYKDGTVKPNLKYMGKVVKKSRDVVIDGRVVTFKSNVILKAIK